MRRSAVFGLTILTAVLLQSTVFARLTLFGVSPDLVVAVVICFALIEGATAGAVLGFSGGLLRDLLLDSPKGLTGLSYLIVGYTVGSIRPYLQSTSVMVPAAGVFAGSLSASALYEMLQAMLGRRTGGLDRAIVVILLTAIYNTLLVPFVYPPVKRIAALYRPEKVVQW
ncbi:MAG TPA: rod shape-determining protein MreD [Actinomycetota bacterium]|jgi:rod shape-determining protein MreD|nr:rod shape-determining protein MreD [Actinomycetota bacterium]